MESPLQLLWLIKQGWGVTGGKWEAGRLAGSVTVPRLLGPPPRNLGFSWEHSVSPCPLHPNKPCSKLSPALLPTHSLRSRSGVGLGIRSLSNFPGDWKPWT